MFWKRRLRKYWQGRKVVVTGASSGIGRALVEVLAPYGVEFCLLSRRVEPMKELAEHLRESPSHFWIRSCDVRDRTQVAICLQDFANEKGGIDRIWVNSGLSQYTGMDCWSWEAFETMVDTNFKGAVYTIVEGLKIMIPQKEGAILAVGSAASMRGMPGRGVYSATKIGLEYVMDSLAVEYPHIQFTIIHPGFVETPLNSDNPNRIWVVAVQKAARKMISFAAKKGGRYVFPWQMALVYHIIRPMPVRLFRFLAGKLFRRYSRPGPSQMPEPLEDGEKSEKNSFIKRD